MKSWQTTDSSPDPKKVIEDVNGFTGVAFEA
jgi:hypothetical protein